MSEKDRKVVNKAIKKTNKKLTELLNTIEVKELEIRKIELRIKHLEEKEIEISKKRVGAIKKEIMELYDEVTYENKELWKLMKKVSMDNNPELGFC